MTYPTSNSSLTYVYKNIINPFYKRHEKVCIIIIINCHIDERPYSEEGGGTHMTLSPNLLLNYLGHCLSKTISLFLSLQTAIWAVMILYYVV